MRRFKLSRVGSYGALPRCAGCPFLPLLCFACSAVLAQLSVCAVRQMRCWGDCPERFNNPPVQLSGAVAAESQGPAAAWECTPRVGWQPAGAGHCQSCILKQWPEQRKAVVALRDKYDPWPWGDTGELILEVCNEKILL